MDRPNVVGTIHSAGGFSAAAGTAITAAEVRVDLLPVVPRTIDFEAVPVPVILTVRRRDEGGGKAWTDAERRALYLKYLPFVRAIDIEGRSLHSLRKIVEAAKTAGCAIIVSYHDFSGTPSLAQMRKYETAARAAGADVVKIASTTTRPAEVARLLDLLDGASGPLAVMGMGKLGRASRLLFARAGSVLNYGWLDRPQVPGQWGAGEFCDLLARA